MIIENVHSTGKLNINISSIPGTRFLSGRHQISLNRDRLLTEELERSQLRVLTSSAEIGTSAVFIGKFNDRLEYYY